MSRLLVWFMWAIFKAAYATQPNAQSAIALWVLESARNES